MLDERCGNIASQHCNNNNLWALYNIATTLNVNVATTLCGCCTNIVPMLANVVPTLSQRYNNILVSFSNIGNHCWHSVQATLYATLWQHHWPTLVTSVETMPSQWCENVVAMSLPNVNDQSWDNIRTILCERCGNVDSQHWWLMLEQRSANVVWMLWQCYSPTLGQCSGNIVSMWWQFCSQCWWLTLRHHSDIIAWTLSQCHSTTLGTDFETMLRQHCVPIRIYSNNYRAISWYDQ